MILHITYDDAALPIQVFKWTPNAGLDPQHHHPSLEMGLCLSGSGKFHFGSTVYSVAPGDLYIVNRLESHIAQSDPEQPCEFIFLNFDAILLEQEEPELMLPFRYFPFHLRNKLDGDEAARDRIRQLLRQLLEEKSRLAPGHRTAMKSLLLLLCAELLRMAKTEISEPVWSNGLHHYEQIRPVLQHLEEHYQQDLDLTQLARFFHLSPSHLSRLILEATGRKFKSHILTLRVQHAKRLLAVTAMSVTDICYDSGFQSLAAFYRNFKQAVHLSPEEYRRLVLQPGLPNGK